MTYIIIPGNSLHLYAGFAYCQKKREKNSNICLIYVLKNFFKTTQSKIKLKTWLQDWLLSSFRTSSQHFP